jgi:hypothetical protein
VQFGILGILVAAVVAAVVGLGILLDFNIAKAGTYIGTGSFALLVVAFIIEYRRRSKRFSKK